MRSRAAKLVPKLKSFDCTDHHPIEQWQPESTQVLYWLVLHIGMPGTPAADMFTVAVATPEGLKTDEWRRYRRQRQVQYPPIVLNPYSWAGVLEAVDERLNACAGGDWLEMQELLRLQFHWEYENFR